MLDSLRNGDIRAQLHVFSHVALLAMGSRHLRHIKFALYKVIHATNLTGTESTLGKSTPSDRAVSYVAVFDMAVDQLCICNVHPAEYFHFETTPRHVLEDLLRPLGRGWDFFRQWWPCPTNDSALDRSCTANGRRESCGNDPT